MTPHITERKAELRTAILERIQHMDDQARSAESRSIVRRALEVLPADRAVCAFFPLKTEPDIRPLLRAIITRKQVLYLPAFDGQRLVMRRTADLSQLEQSPLGIPEPAAEAAALDRHIPVIALIPGRAFDLSGNRLGRGNGGYDRWINAHRGENGKSLYYAVAFECQLVASVPVEAHDAPIDGIVTVRGLTSIQK